MRINFVGDVGIFKKFEQLEIDPFAQIDLPAADLNIGNFEFIISKSAKPFFYDVQEQYSCSFEYFEKLRISKFQGFGFANNHALDYGLEGAKDTIKHLQQNNITVFGFSEFEEYSVGEFSCEGIRLAIIGFVKEGRWSKSNFGYGPDSYNLDKILDLIEDLKKNHDHVIVYPHWGTELIEIPDIIDARNAKRFIETGATAVIGHHPHISQGIEKYQNGLIAYSLGSFIYAHEEELGYSQRHPNRHYSICLNLELDKQGIVSHKAYFYKYNLISKIPEICTVDMVTDYSRHLNDNIHNQRIFKKQLYNVLIRREINSFWQRFKKKPFVTLREYIKFIHPRHIKKLIS